VDAGKICSLSLSAIVVAFFKVQKVLIIFLSILGLRDSGLQWHEVVTFRWLEPPPIGCGFPYDLGLEKCPYWRLKT
jgi:hypothetical protein